MSMLTRLFRLLVLLPGLLSMAGYGQDLPSAEILTEDAEWCQLPDNLTVGRILITGEIDTSRFDLIVGIRGSRDTLVNLPSGIFELYLNNQPGYNEYIVYKVIEYQAHDTLENEVLDTLIMQVHPWPDMTLRTEIESPCSPADVVLRGKEGYPSYTWDFGDGSGTTTATNWISHSYDIGEEADAMLFETRLTVETEFGCVDSVSGQVTIYQTPEVAFDVSPQLLYYPQTTVSLTNATGDGDWGFRWDFGDGTYDYNRDPGEHTFGSWGTYRIGLLGYSSHCRDSISKEIEIRPPVPEADFSPDTSGCPPLTVSFVDQTLYADEYYWDFDDGTGSWEEDATHTFTASGTYHVELFASNVTGTDSSERTITVFDTPVPMFEPGTTESSLRGEEIEFDNLSTGATRFLWDFGDGSTSEEESPAHGFMETGDYTITLYAWSSEECTDTLVREDLISILEGEGSCTFPNAFRWNGSGPTGGHWTPGSEDNTVFHPDVENATALRMIILSRTGHKIFETNNVYVGWDGYIDESLLAGQGVYIYQAWITYSDGSKEELIGDITFIH